MQWGMRVSCKDSDEERIEDTKRTEAWRKAVGNQDCQHGIGQSSIKHFYETKWKRRSTRSFKPHQELYGGF